MDFLQDLLSGPIGIPLIIAGCIVGVEVYKRWMVRQTEKWWYGASLLTVSIAIAYVLSILAYFGNEQPITLPIAGRVIFQGLVLGLAAAGGYDLIKKGLESFQLFRSGTTITVGDMENVTGASIGTSSSSETDIEHN